MLISARHTQTRAGPDIPWPPHTTSETSDSPLCISASYRGGQPGPSPDPETSARRSSLRLGRCHTLHLLPRPELVPTIFLLEVSLSWHHLELCFVRPRAPSIFVFNRAEEPEGRADLRITSCSHLCRTSQLLSPRPGGAQDQRPLLDPPTPCEDNCCGVLTGSPASSLSCSATGTRLSAPTQTSPWAPHTEHGQGPRAPPVNPKTQFRCHSAPGPG